MSDVNLMAEKVAEGSHTPGPWTYRDEQDREEVWIGVPGQTVGMKVIATVEYGFTPPADVEQKANARLIAAAPDMYTILDELEGAFDKEIYPEQVKEDFDALDEREYSVTITAKQWRAISRALSKVQHGE